MIPTKNKATITDVKLWLTEKELQELTNERDINNCDVLPIIDAKITNSLELAESLWCGKYIGCKPEGKVALLKIRKVVTLMLTRYFLDVNKTRPSVIEQYKEAIRLIENACCTECGGEISKEDAELIGLDTSTAKVYIYTEPGTLDRSQTTNYTRRNGVFASSATRSRYTGKHRYW